MKETHYSFDVTSIDDRCTILRKRRRSQSTQYNANAVFFRSKLSLPLSPSTPAIIVDMIIDNDVVGDKSLYFSIYDMTHRHRLMSDWVSQMKKIFAGKNDKEVTAKESFHEHDSESDEAAVTNVSN